MTDDTIYIALTREEWIEIRDHIGTRNGVLNMVAASVSAKTPLSAEQVARDWAAENGMVIVRQRLRPGHEHDWRMDTSGGNTDWWCGWCGAVRSTRPDEEGGGE